MECLDVKYFSNFLSETEAFDTLKEVIQYDFRQYPVKVKGKLCIPSRKVCAFGDENMNHTFCELNLPVCSWTKRLFNIKRAVENVCEQTFNYAVLNYHECGLNKVGMHEDNESCLDLSASIAYVSLGVTRTIHFTRKKFKTVKLPLKNGSLLIVNPTANTLWSHGIPSEPKITEPYISITFRKLVENSACDEIIEPSAKRLCLREIHNDKAMGNFFTSISQTPYAGVIPADTIPEVMSNKPNKGENLYQKDLGDYVFLRIELFKQQLRIQMRQYDVTKETIFPTKHGVIMDLCTWYEFHHKLVDFSLRYVCASYVANNSLLVLNMNECMYVQNFNYNKQSKNSFIQLNFPQIETLKESVFELNGVLINYLLRKRLTYFIMREGKIVNILSWEEEKKLMSCLINCIETELANVFQKVFECSGCIANHPSQFLHSCINLSNSEKFTILGDTVFLLANMEVIALNFINSVNCISESFINNISISYILNVIFKC